MQALRQMSGGVLIAIVSIVLVIGGLSLALAEQTPAATMTPTQPQIIIFDTATLFIPTQISITNTLPSVSIPDTFTPVPANTNTLPPPPTNCLHPLGWIPVSVAPGTSIEGLAQRYRTTTAELISKNCLTSTQLPAGFIIYVPYIPPTAIPCTHPAGWLQYTVQSGDTLFHIASTVGLTTLQLQRANCLASANDIYVGQKLWLPYLPPTATIGSIVFPPATDTATPVPPTDTSTSIPTSVPPTDTTVPTIAPTNTASQPADTITPFPTKTP